MTVAPTAWDDVTVGQAIPPVVEEITYRRVIMNPGVTGDYFPGHHDPDYARRQGQPTIYANSLHLFGLLDRTVLQWAGPAGFLMRRNVRLHSSMYAGDTVTVAGAVTGKHMDDDARIVEADLTITNQNGGVICSAAATVRLPG